MSQTPLTPEQKLDAIYNMLKGAQSARRWATFFRLVKWTAILGVVYILSTNPNLIMHSVMERIQPIIMEQVQSILDGQKNALMNKMKDLVPSQSSPIDSISQ